MKTFTVQLKRSMGTYFRGKDHSIEAEILTVTLALNPMPPRFCLDCGHKTVYFCGELHTPPTANLRHFYQVCIDCDAVYHVVSCGNPQQFKNDMIVAIKAAL